jgi:hypothetical protein
VSESFLWLVRHVGIAAAIYLVKQYDPSEKPLEDFIREYYRPQDPERQTLRQCLRACVAARSSPVVVSVNP